MTIVQRQCFDAGMDQSSTLAVLIHAWLGGPERLTSVEKIVRSAYPGCAIYAPAVAFRRLEPLESLAARLVDEIDELMHEGQYSRIVFVGHSVGSLVVRRAAILAHGESEEAPFEPGLERFKEPRFWADRIDRLVLLAGLTRGWTVTAAQDWLTTVLYRTGNFLAEILTNGRATILGARRGSPFVVQTRLQWLALVKRRTKPLAVVQLLGSVDDLVSPEDNIDYAVDLGSETFALMDLPQTDHKQAVVCEGDAAAQERGRRLFSALIHSPYELRARGDAVPIAFVANGPPPKADMAVTDVIFVIHGIRDRGFWTQKIARRAMAEAQLAGRVARSMTMSYGYLAMLPFVMPWVRRDKVRWLMDRYADCRALYPAATFHYVGHSNGSYLVARALRDYPAARFQRIVLAGSVLRTDYDWRSVITNGRNQAGAVMNYVASGDWVVAIFPHGLSPFRALDLGGAGHFGFDQLAAPNSGTQAAWISSVDIGGATSYQVHYIDGGHGAGIKESQWDEIANFVVHGRPPSTGDPDYVPLQKGWVAAASRLPPLTFMVLAIVLLSILAGATFLFACLFGIAGGMIAGFLSLLLLYALLTKF